MFLPATLVWRRESRIDTGSAVNVYLVVRHGEYPRHGRAAFTRAGLQSADLVTAINGTQLNSSSESNGVLDQLSGSNVANVTISRSGHELQLTLNMS